MLRNDTQQYKRKYINSSKKQSSRQSQATWKNQPINKLFSTIRSQKNNLRRVQSLDKTQMIKQQSQRKMFFGNNITTNNLFYQSALKNKLTTQPKSQVKSEFPFYTFQSITIDPKKVKTSFNAFPSDFQNSSRSKQLQKTSTKKLINYAGSKNQQPFLDPKTSTKKLVNFSESQAQQPFLDPKTYFKIKIDSESDSNTHQKSQSLHNMKLNDLFFCTECLLYVFKIELKYHFPLCQQKVFIKNTPLPDKIKLGWEKLRILVQLAQHTETKTQQIQNLYDKYKQQWHRSTNNSFFLQDENEENCPRYYFLEDIDQAMQLTYNKLLRNSKLPSANCLINC